MSRDRLSSSLVLVLLLLLAAKGRVACQDGRLGLERAVELARRNYPVIRAMRAAEGAAAAGADAARASLLPRVELDWQQTRGTRNNIFGPFFPQGSVNPISGPLLDRSSIGESVWGSGGGLAVTWELFDFGARRAGIDLAERRREGARAQAVETEFEAEIAAVERFLTVAAAEQKVRSAIAAVERLEIFAREVEALVASELRPGADSSRTAIELAIARNGLIEARRDEALARVALAEALGLAGQVIAIDAELLLRQHPADLRSVSRDGQRVEAAGVGSIHPLLLRQQAEVEVVKARRKMIERSILPRLSWQTNLFVRGSGALIDGRRLANRGLYPDTANWLTGLTLTFVPSEIFRNRADRREEEQNLAAAAARLEEARQSLKSDESRARALAEAALAFAANAPVQLEAARLTELRVRKRYDAELGTVAEVAEAQRLLSQAEVGMALAHLSLWRVRLAECRVGGDLAPLLALLPEGGVN